MSETNEIEFIGGVRVFVKDPNQKRELKGKKLQTLEKLAKICRYLGGLWTLGYFGDNDTQFFLVYDGGKNSPTGIEIWLHNSYSDESYMHRPDYWKFEMSGNYPQPQHSNDALPTSESPRATINISDPMKAATLINSRLIPGIKEFTAKARANCKRVIERDQGFQERVETVAEMINTPVSPVWLEHHRSEHKFPYQSAHGTTYITVNKFSDRISFGTSFTVDELAAVLRFVEELRTPKEEQNFA